MPRSAARRIIPGRSMMSTRSAKFFPDSPSRCNQLTPCDSMRVDVLGLRIVPPSCNKASTQDRMPASLLSIIATVPSTASTETCATHAGQAWRHFERFPLHGGEDRFLIYRQFPKNLLFRDGT